MCMIFFPIKHIIVPVLCQRQALSSIPENIRDTKENFVYGTDQKKVVMVKNPRAFLFPQIEPALEINILHYNAREAIAL